MRLTLRLKCNNSFYNSCLLINQLIKGRKTALNGTNLIYICLAPILAYAIKRISSKPINVGFKWLKAYAYLFVC